ncbi:hypothetical protein EFM17_04360 [Lactobacillus delbrueckii]|nr:hypothetical protein [Lactobacillus delbrueckii]
MVKNEEFADTRVLHSSVFSCLKQKNKKFYLFSPGKITIIRTILLKEKDFPPQAKTKAKLYQAALITTLPAVPMIKRMKRLI